MLERHLSCTMFPYSASENTKVFSTQERNLQHTARLSTVSSLRASRTSSCHSSVFAGQTDLHGPPNIEAPMSAKQLKPRGWTKTKQTNRWAGMSPPTVRHLCLGMEPALLTLLSHSAMKFYTVPSSDVAHQKSIDSQVLHLREAPP